MAKFAEQVVHFWDEWVEETGQDVGNPDDFVVWAIENKKLALPPQDVRKLLRTQVTSALRQVTRVDENGIRYRGKQCVMVFEDGGQTPLWFDTDTGGTPNTRKKAVHQRREAIANDVYRAKCDVDHMNFVHPDENIQFVMDFEEDYRERNAADAIINDDEEEAA